MKERNFEFKDLESLHNAIESLKKSKKDKYVQPKQFVDIKYSEKKYF